MTSPTTFELAQLASNLSPRLGNERDAVRQASALWREAEIEIQQAGERADYLKEIVENIYTDSPDEWKSRIDEYTSDKYGGSKEDIDRLMAKQVSTDKVMKRVLRDKSLTNAQRKSLFVGLATFAEAHGINPPPTRQWAGWPKLTKYTDEELKDPHVNGILEDEKAGRTQQECNTQVAGGRIDFTTHSQVGCPHTHEANGR